MSGQTPPDPSGNDPNQPAGNPYTNDPAAQPQHYEIQPAPGGGNAKWIILALCAGMFIPILGICVGLLLPAVQQAREAARRMGCSNNMKQVAIALHNYHSTYNSLPPAYTTDENGQPLHSWRTLILPFLEQQALYEQIDFSKPWDDPANITLAQTVVPTYACPSTVAPPTMTTYVAVVDPQGIMSGPTPTKFQQVIDGLSNTIMLVECDSDLAVPWMQPRDIGLQEFLDTGTARNTGGHLGGAHVVLGDGAVRFITDSADPEIRRAMITISNGEDLGTP